MPFPVPNKANKTPISTILKWYLERKKGKVVESRQEIQRRFGGLDWAIQKKIILAFLSSGKADRKWAYEQLIWYWDNDFLPKTKELFEQYHEKKIFWPVIWYFPTDYIIDHLDELAVDHSYYNLCYRLAHDHVEFQPDRHKLSPNRYLTIMELMNKKVEDTEAEDIIFEVLHDLSTNRFSKYDGVSPRHIVSKGQPLVATDFAYVYVLFNKLRNLHCMKATENFSLWEHDLLFIIMGSDEFKLLNKKDPDDYDERRKNITKRYIFQLLPDKYKFPSDETPFASNMELFQKMSNDNPSILLLTDRLGLELSD